jgi:hypothetical protein|tara:strand:+ start:3249 stop:3500 length:252 start_codon:yes stop_codon:yes gene_type:complete
MVRKKTSKRNKKINNAMKHKDVPGAGAKKRRKLKPSDRSTAVMKEYKRGTLRSGKSGKVVTNKKQARAIAISESGKRKNKKRK